MASSSTIVCCGCGFTRRLSARGLCNRCYKQRQAHRIPMPPRQNRPAAEWLALSRAGGAECWPWAGPTDADGYGVCGHARAHRWAYEAMVGPIPSGLTLDHLCDNPPCVNPAHLKPATIRDNVLRSPLGVTAVNARKTHCHNGHEFTPANTYIPPSTIRRGKPQRQCRECKLAWQLAKRAS